MNRQKIVVDVETNGLDPAKHVAVEVAWFNLDTGDSGQFVPRHNVSETLRHADIQALRINRYIDRLADATQDDGTAAAVLADQLDGNTLCGSNVAFDESFLPDMFRATIPNLGKLPEWHHRKMDLSNIAATVFNHVLESDIGNLPGLATVCEILEIHNTDPHTAWGDVLATATCFRHLFVINDPNLTEQDRFEANAHQLDKRRKNAVASNEDELITIGVTPNSNQIAAHNKINDTVAWFSKNQEPITVAAIKCALNKNQQV